MKALNGEQIFIRMSDLDARLVAEALPPSMRAGAAGVASRRVRRASAFWSSGWTAAVLSGVVALGALIAIIVAGQNGTGQPPVGTQVPIVTGAPMESATDEPETKSKDESITESETTNEEQIPASQKLVFYYYDSSTHKEIATNDWREFAEHCQPNTRIEVSIWLSYPNPPACTCRDSIPEDITKEEVNAIREKHNAHIREYHQAQKQPFLEAALLSDDDPNYQLYNSDYLPMIQLTFQTYTVLEETLPMMMDLAEDSLVDSIRVRHPQEAVPD